MLKTLCFVFFSLIVCIDVSAKNLFERALDYFDDDAYDEDDYDEDYNDDDDYNRQLSRRHRSYNDRNYLHRRDGSSRNFASIPTSHNVAVKNVCISSDGTRIARVIKNGTLEEVVVRLSEDNEKAFFHSTVPIEGIYFVGRNYLLCLFRSNSSNYCHLKSINLLNGKCHDILPIDRATYINVLPSKFDDSVCSVSYDGKKYFVHDIDVKRGRTQRMVESYIPPVLDKELQPRIFYKRSSAVFGENSGFDVFAIPEGENSNNAKRIDHINDTSKEIYISVTGNYCYKLSVQNGKDLVIKRLDLADNSESTHVINGVNKLSSCRMNVDAEGNPLFVTIGHGSSKRKNIAVARSVEEDVSAINDKFGNVGWYRIGATADGSLWILCSCTNPHRYFLYNSAAKKMTEILVIDKNTVLPTVSDLPPHGIQIS